MPSETPTQPGWYRARWNECYVAPWPTPKWGCVEVVAVADDLAVWSERVRGWVDLGAIAEWGERVVMPDEVAP